MHTHWHLRDAHELAREHGVDPALGLDEAEAALRVLRHGPNEIAGGPQRTPLSLLIAQFKDFMILVLIGAAIISGVIGELIDTLAIVVIVLLNALIGFVQAWRADRALAALQQLAAARATVLRGGERQALPASQLVPGDIVLLEAGNQVPADLRLIEIAQLRVDESALTGESVAVDKHTQTLQDAARPRSATGSTWPSRARPPRTAAAAASWSPPAWRPSSARWPGLLDRAGETQTPLQLRLAAFGKRLALVVLAICALIFVVGVLRGESPVLMVLTAVSLAVAAIPESLPAVVTVLLALGARRMVRAQRAGAAPALGGDAGLGQHHLLRQDRHADAQPHAGRARACAEGAAHAETLRAAALCNDAVRGPDGAWQGDPTETALTTLAADERAGQGRAGGRLSAHRRAALRFAAQAHEHAAPRADGGFVLYTKGAPESLLPRCTARWRSDDEGGTAPLDLAADDGRGRGPGRPGPARARLRAARRCPTPTCPPMPMRSSANWR